MKKITGPIHNLDSHLSPVLVAGWIREVFRTLDKFDAEGDYGGNRKVN
jgi:hypothetical protein